MRFKGALPGVFSILLLWGAFGVTPAQATIGNNNCDPAEDCMYKNAGPNTPLFDTGSVYSNLNLLTYPIGGGQVGDTISAIWNRGPVHIRYFIDANLAGSSMCVYAGHQDADLRVAIVGIVFQDNLSSTAQTADSTRCV
jgi:hypothetical protein